jgi:hypothetical protein
MQVRGRRQEVRPQQAILLLRLWAEHFGLVCRGGFNSPAASPDSGHEPSEPKAAAHLRERETPHVSSILQPWP